MNIRLTQFAFVARAAGYEIPTEMSMRKIREKATEARFPATLVNQIWYFDRGDVDTIAAALGLTRQSNQQLVAA
jgi:hypothetical protein